MLSRKMRHTGVVMIGSRQHYDDLYGYNLDDPTWDTIVESAHSDDCNEEWTESAPHDECMLFPELNPYSWLLELRQDYQAKGLIGLWEMVYLNRPRPEGMTVFSQEAVESCYDRTRRIGQMPESHYRLVAGLDPAAAGYQASFLWAYTLDDQRQYLVDLDNTKGGGIIEALRIIQTWYEKYRVAYWVIENNGLQQMYLQDLRVRDFCLQNNVVLEPHRTYINKLDPFFGVSAMSRLFNERVANLPFYGEEAKAKTKLYTRQLM
ncbi:MAG: hypothetical protein GWN97_10310, partial [Thermoplasmata archaeon]|nr:hypothetical protein [Thermoplasmata archaeon]